jgi:WhiB family transcriptional regulator, redox-sensing transcriptional regulator
MAYQTRTSWGLDSRGGDWRENAACRPGGNVNPEWFFNDRRGEDAVVFDRAAKRICGICDLVDDCLEFAVERREVFGVFGGLTPDERRSLMRAEGRSLLREECRSGRHRMEGDNVGWSRGGRFCKACRVVTMRDWHAKRAAVSS